MIRTKVKIMKMISMRIAIRVDQQHDEEEGPNKEEGGKQGKKIAYIRKKKKAGMFD
jgi:hypothetical protein